MKKKSKKKKQDIAKVNPELEGLDIRINPVGELVSNVSLVRKRRKEILSNHKQSMKELREGKIKFY